MITEIPLKQIPNQTLRFTIDDSTYAIELCSRLGNLFITVKKNDDYLVCNRVCRNMTYLCKWLFFADQQGNKDPEYTELGTRYKLVWANGV